MLQMRRDDIEARLESVQHEAVKFQSVDALFVALNNLDSDVLRIKGVTKHDFEDIVKKREAERKKFRIRYDATKTFLFITIPTAGHEISTVELTRKIDRDMMRMGVDDRFKFGGATTFTHPNGMSRAEADSIGFPKQPRLAGDWPTLVLEVGDSETLTELRNGMRWWFAASDHQVKIVILWKLYRELKNFYIEKYTEQAPPGRTRASNTRNMPRLAPVRRQQITVDYLPGSSNPMDFNVNSTPLILETALLFYGNDGLINSTARDVMVSEDDMKDVAETVWHSGMA